MKKINFLICFLISLQTGATHLQIGLQKALERKLVSAKVVALGGHEGFCMTMTLKNLSKDSLLVFVEAGRRLNSIDDKYQDILVVKEEMIVLRTMQEKTFRLKGYCCQAAHLCPGSGSKYDVHKLADSNLVKLARFLNHNEFEKEAEQQAVWALSDKHPVANISGVNDSLLEKLRNEISGIKGEVLPWYRIVTKKYIYPNGSISVTPLLVKGTINYSNEKENYATLSVLNEKGIAVCQLKSEWLKAGVNENYKLELSVKGLAKGKYTVELKTSEKQLAKRQFEI